MAFILVSEKKLFFCGQKLEEWENFHFKFLNKCRILSALQYNMWVTLEGMWQTGTAGALHFHCGLSTFLLHPWGSVPPYSIFTRCAYFSVCGTFISVVCVTAVLLISSYNPDLRIQYITLNDGVWDGSRLSVLGLGSPNDPLVELKKRLI